MGANPLDEGPPNCESTARDGGDDEAVLRTEEPFVEDADADAEHNVELMLGFFTFHRRKRGPRHDGVIHERPGDAVLEVPQGDSEDEAGQTNRPPAKHPLLRRRTKRVPQAAPIACTKESGKGRTAS